MSDIRSRITAPSTPRGIVIQPLRSPRSYRVQGTVPTMEEWRRRADLVMGMPTGVGLGPRADRTIPQMLEEWRKVKRRRRRRDLGSS